jgi:hypothetical protein
VGDIEVLREVERQLTAAALPWNVAPLPKWIARHRPEWLDIRAAKPSDYTHLLVVCGPLWRQGYIRHGISDAFAHCTRIGVSLVFCSVLSAPTARTWRSHGRVAPIDPSA